MSLNFEELDEQFDAGKCKEVMDVLEKALAENDKDIEVAWRLARCQFETGTLWRQTALLTFKPPHNPTMTLKKSGTKKLTRLPSKPSKLHQTTMEVCELRNVLQLQVISGLALRLGTLESLSARQR